MPARTTNEFLNGNKDAPSEKERNGRKVLDKDSPYTHWSFLNKDKWFVDEDDLDEFYKLYCADVRNSKPLYLTEKSTNVSMMRVDLDFKFEGVVPEHKHTQEQVVSFVKAYLKEVKDLVKVPESVEVFILEKDYPTVETKNATKVSKSGIHIHIPSIKARPNIEHAVRRKLVRRMDEFFSGISLMESWDKVYDQSILNHNGHWCMIGSKKEGDNALPYLIRYILDWDSETGDISIDSDVPIITPKLLKEHSVRSRDSDMTPLTPDGEAICKPTPERSQSVGRGGRPAIMPGTNASRGSSPGRNYIEPLSKELYDYYSAHLDNLTPHYYSDYKAWTDVGICLKNIHPDLERAWLDFSSKYADYKEDESIIKWNTFGSRNDGIKLTKASLLYWSRESNFEGFQKIERENVDKLLDIASKSGREYDIAQIIHALYRDEFVCSSYEKSDWYQFVGHTWKNISRGVPLLARISGESANKFLKKEKAESDTLLIIGNCEHSPKDMKPEECEKCACKLRKKQYLNMYNKLGQTGFKDNIMKECKLLFFDGDFENKLNNNKTLLAFNNGVYDLQTHEFRQGQPEDYISKCTNLDYNITMNHTEYECWPELEKFLKSILPRQSVRVYFLRHVASCLAGAEGSQKFHIMTGSGSNGKSLFTNLIVKSFGTYATKVPISLMTQKRNKSSAANPEIMKMRGCRFGSMAEPDEGEALSTGLLKELSGGESITSRDLYAGSKDMQDFVLQIRLHLACNEKPKVTTNDGGTWRRLVVIDFPSKFVAKPNPANKNELPMDETIDFKVNSPEWAECFMAMLVSIYKEGNGWRKMEPPKEVMEYTNEYHEESDAIAKFMNEYIHTDAETPGEPFEPVIKAKITEVFKEWKRNNEIQKGNVDELMKRIEAQFGKYHKGGWTNFRVGSN